MTSFYHFFIELYNDKSIKTKQDKITETKNIIHQIDDEI